MTTFSAKQRITIFVSLLFFASQAIGEGSAFNGVWNSKEWRYGFKIEGMTGTVTDWNNDYNPADKTTTGDLILTITKMTETSFVGVHKFYDGSMIDVTAEIIDKNTIELKGRREVWRMTREKQSQ